MLAVLIVACEVSFWLLVLAGLSARYIFQKKNLGSFLLLCTPVVDLILLIVTVIDIKNGETATFFHSLAAIYIGVSIAFGPSMIRWADERFAHRFAGEPQPQKRPKHGKSHALQERQGWYRHLLAWVIGCSLLGGMIWFVGDWSRTMEFVGKMSIWTRILLIDFIISFSYTLWPRKEKTKDT